MRHDVFICHSSEDKAVADKICSFLETNGISCWIAPRNILAGDSWGASIITAIKNCGILLFVFSSNANNSKHVVRELCCAADNSKCIIPFRIEKTDLSASVEYFISESQWLDAFPHPAEQHFQILSTTIKQILVKSDQPSEISSFPSTKKTTGYQEELKSVSQALHEKQWQAGIRLCLEIFERAMKELIRNILCGTSDSEVQERILSVSKAIGNKVTDPDDFEFDKLVNLFQQADLFSVLRVQLTSNLQKIKTIDWKALLKWHKALSEQDNNLDEKEALQTAHWLRVFLFDCELIGQAIKITPLHEPANNNEICSYCNKTVNAEWIFCPQCGGSLSLKCSTCRRPLDPNFKICPYCETAIPKRGKAENQEEDQAREEYRVLCVGAYLDGVLNIRERQLLEKKRLELGLSNEDATIIERQCAPPSVIEFTHLVECVLLDDLINEEESVFLERKAQELKLDSWVAQQIIANMVEQRKIQVSD